MDELRKDPSATFEVGADLPSGNRMIGTVGLLINGKICASLRFEKDPPSQQDIDHATQAMNGVMGVSGQTAVVHGEAEAAAKMREMLGGERG